MGLSGAAHLNGATGEIRRTADANLHRFVVRLDVSGKEVSVKTENVERIRGGSYRRRAP